MYHTQTQSSWIPEGSNGKRRRGLVALVVVVLLWSTLAVPIAWTGATNISWSPEKIEVNVFPGTSAVESVTFTASQNLLDGSLWVVPELQRFIVVEPESFDSVSAGVPYSVVLFVSVPSDTAFDIYDGTLHLKIGKRTLPQTLKIVLSTEEPTVEDIPETVALPSEDRIVEDPDSGAVYLMDEVLVGFAPGTSQEAVRAVVSGIGGVFLGSILDLNLYQVQIPAVSDPYRLEQIIQQLEAQPEVEIATYSWIDEARKIPSEGKDPRWDDWDEENPMGNNWAHEFVKLPSAWDFTTGSKSIKIGVVDVGFDIGHEDLRGNIDPSISALPVHEHGTSILGIIGAKGNNEVGISGVMWDTTLLPYSVKVPLREKGMPFVYTIPKILDAIEAGAKVISYSGGTDHWFEWSANMENRAWKYFLLDYFKDRNVLFVFAAGQESVDDKYSSPSSLSREYSNVVSVTASGMLGDLYGGSNYGDISVAAPGQQIYSTLPDNNYGLEWGTSFASPFVAGLAGLIYSKAKEIGKSITAAEVKNLIIQGAINGGKYVEGPDGHKIPIINAYASLRLLITPHESLDYFKITEGHGIKYHVTDDHGDLDCNVWAVSQYFETNKPDELDFVFTLVKEGTKGGYFRSSSIGGAISRRIDGEDLTLFYAGCPVGNQANFYFHFSLPRFFNSGDEWSVGDREYRVEHVGPQAVNGIKFGDCIKVTVDDSWNPSKYLRGSGYFILARGVGIVKLVFNRTNGQNVLYEYIEHGQLIRHTISGKINSRGTPVKGIIVQISNANWGIRSVTDSNGAFSIQAYGPDVVLRIGYDKDNDDVFDFDDPDYPIEYCVNNIVSDVSGLIIDVNPSPLIESIVLTIYYAFWKYDIKTTTKTRITWYLYDIDKNLVHTYESEYWATHHGGTFGGYIPSGEDGYVHLKVVSRDERVERWPSESEMYKIERPELSPVIPRAWTSDSIRGLPPIAEFPAGTERVYVNYFYENPIGSVQKIIWYDTEGNVLGSREHISERVSGIGTWDLGYPGEEFWPGGSYRAELFINDILLATVTWTVL